MSLDIYKLQVCNLRMADFNKAGGNFWGISYLQQRTISYHEAGHAVIAATRGFHIKEVRLYGIYGNGSGYTWLNPRIDRKNGGFRIRKTSRGRLADKAERAEINRGYLPIYLAGLIAEDIRFGKPYYPGSESDLRKFHVMTSRVIGRPATGSEIMHWRDKIWKSCHKELEENWEWVEAVASELIKRKTLFHKDVMRLRPAEHTVTETEGYAELIYVDFSNRRRSYDDDLVC